MKCCVRPIIPLLALIIAFVPCNRLAAETANPATSAASDAAWESVLAEADELLAWSEDSLAEIDLELDLPPEPVPEKSSLLTFAASLSAGGGHSSNYLKRNQALSSGYLQLDGDFFLSVYRARSSLSALVFFEAVDYARSNGAGSEWFVFSTGNWTRNAGSFSYGAEFEFFAADQIYDASLSTVAEPKGDRLRQIRPQAALFGQRRISARDSLRLEVAGRRSTFDTSRDAYWRAASDVEWQRQWTRSLRTVTRIGFHADFFDEKPARQANGLPAIPAKTLRLRGLTAEESVTWSPKGLPSLRTTGRLGISREEDGRGVYDDATRWWAAVGANLSLKFVQLSVTGRRQDTRYAHRQVSFLDPLPQRQSWRSLKIEARRPLPWNLSLKAAVEWSEFHSRIASEQFSERRVRAVLDWTY